MIDFYQTNTKPRTNVRWAMLAGAAGCMFMAPGALADWNRGGFESRGSERGCQIDIQHDRNNRNRHRGVRNFFRQIRGFRDRRKQRNVCKVTAATPGWGIINRNTIGSPFLQFRTGPNGFDIDGNVVSEPPFGHGSLNLLVEGPDTGERPADSDKINYANTADFKGVRLSQIDYLAYWVFHGTDNPAAESVPAIAIEIDPENGGGYSQLVYLPGASMGDSAPDGGPDSNVWQQYEPLAEGNQWTASGTNCRLQTPCSFEQIKAEVGADSEITLTFGIQKGRDNEFQGAIDGVTFNDTVFDFEAPKY